MKKIILLILMNNFSMNLVCNTAPTQTSFTTTTEKGVICVPVADLFGQSLASLYPDCCISDKYMTMPLCPGQKNGAYACPRLHQLLYVDCGLSEEI